MRKAIVTVVGTDRKGIIAAVSAALFDLSINILDINQTIMQEFFVMIMLVDISDIAEDINDVTARLHKVGEQLGVSVRIQRQEIFEAMHRI